MKDPDSYIFSELNRERKEKRSDPTSVNILTFTIYPLSKSTGMPFASTYFIHFYRNFLISVDGKWSKWDEWSACSALCGPGTQLRTRTCTDPIPAHEGKPCAGDPNQTQACQVKECPSNNIFSLSLWAIGTHLKLLIMSTYLYGNELHE